MGTNLWECGILVGWSVGSDSESLQRVQVKSFSSTTVLLGRYVSNRPRKAVSDSDR